MESLIFSEDLCRLCLWRSNKLLPIFSEEGEMQEIPLKIGACLPITVSRDDVLPKLICNQCIYKLEMFSEFRNSCVRSEELLKRYTHDTPSQRSTMQIHQVQVHIPQMHQTQPIQSMQRMQQTQPLPQMQQSPVPGSEQVKMEVLDSQSVDVGEDVPFMCLIPDSTVAASSGSPTQAMVSEPHQQTPVITSVKSMGVDIKDSDILNLNNSSDSSPGNSQRVGRRSSVKKTSNKPQPLAVKRMYIVNEPDRESRASNSSVTSRRNVHRCKHCSKNFASRVQLSQHLTSSNCLFRVTCRYCAKIFGSAESRIQHERNHRDKKNFICRICKQKFQSSFDLNVHTVHGCEKTAASSSHTPKKSEPKKQRQTVQEKNNKVRVNGTNESQGLVSDEANSRIYLCVHCNKAYAHRLPFQKHIRSCKRSTNMTRIHAVKKKFKLKQGHENLLKSNLAPSSSIVNQHVNRRIQSIYSSDTRLRRRRRQNMMGEENTLADSTVKDTAEISPKASLLAVLGLREKTNSGEINLFQKTDEIKTNRSSPDINDDEVVTVCDICRKIFTSEAGMLNHQISVHNRNLTAEKINSLMRVEI